MKKIRIDNIAGIPEKGILKYDGEFYSYNFDEKTKMAMRVENTKINNKLNKISNPRIQSERNTLYKVLHMVERIEEKELPEGSVTIPGWTEFEQGKDHAYETVIFNITLMMEKLNKEEKDWKK